ncbi:MAG: hypothetical protein WC350_01265 [Candidatus Micrarchaeia archaeon]
MTHVQVARVLVRKVPDQKPNFGDPVLEKYAKLGLTLTNRTDERTMQLVSVGLVAASMRRLMPLREAEITAAEGGACDDIKRRDGTPAIVWPKAEFLVLLPADLSDFAGRKFMDDEVVHASRDVFLASKESARAQATEQPARPQATEQPQAAAA